MLVIRRICGNHRLRGPLTGVFSSHLCQLRKIEVPTNSDHQSKTAESTNSNDATKKNAFFSNSREGDWVCPKCGVLSFSWRNVCFNCGVSKSPLATKTSSKLGQKSSSNSDKFKNKQNSKDEISLKDLLIQSKQTRDYDLVLKESEKILKQKKLIKSSVVATMISAFGKAGQVDRAIELFNEIGTHRYIVRRPTPYHYAAAITACSENGKWETALDVFDHMRVNSKTRNIVVCTSAMSACNKAKQYNQVIRIYNTIQSEEWVLDTTCYNVVLDSFVKIGNYTKAFELYEEMRSNKMKRDNRTYGIMLECCSHAGDWVLAQELLKQINLSTNVEINAIMYTSAAMAYTNGGEPEKALELFSKLKTETKILFDYPLYSALLQTLNKLPAGRNSGIQSLETLKEMAKRHIKLSVHIVTTVISCLDKDEMYDSAMILFDMARGNGMFADLDPVNNLFKSITMSTETQNVTDNTSNEKDNSNEKDQKLERRVDLRNCSQPMIRVILRSFFTRIKEADSPPPTDYLLILGNSNMASAAFVESLFVTNLFPNNPIRVQQVDEGRLIRVPAKSFKKWLALTKTVEPSLNNSTESSPPTDQPQYQFKVSRKSQTITDSIGEDEKEEEKEAEEEEEDEDSQDDLVENRTTPLRNAHKQQQRKDHRQPSEKKIPLRTRTRRSDESDKEVHKIQKKKKNMEKKEGMKKNDFN